MDEREARPGRAVSRTRNVRFGEMESAIEAAAAAAGLSVSAWLRRLVASHVGTGEGAATIADDGPQRRRLTLRCDIDEVARWEAEARAHDLSLNRYVEWQMALTRDRAARVAEAVHAVQAALVQLAPIGRNLNQLARSWNTYPGQSSKQEREDLARWCGAVEAFCRDAAALVGEFQARRGRRPRRKEGG